MCCVLNGAMSGGGSHHTGSLREMKMKKEELTAKADTFSMKVFILTFFLQNLCRFFSLDTLGRWIHSVWIRWVGGYVW